MRERFKDHIDTVANSFKEEADEVKLVSNLDADGISAAAITSKALTRLGVQHSTRIIHQPDEEIIEDLCQEDYNTYVFTDLGSGDIDLVESRLDGDVLILDHHEPQGEADRAWHVNPHRFDVDGSAEISASGVAFLFARALDQKNEDMGHIAMVGAIGDVQEDFGFHGLNEEIKEIAVDAGVLDVREGLNLYGKERRPLYKLLEYSSDLHIPGVSNSTSGAIQFLQSLGIPPKEDGQWRYLRDLSAQERQQLVAGLVMRCEEASQDDIITPVYTIPHEEGIFSNAKEFATLLNACGRLDKASIGLGACLDKPGFKQKAKQVRKEYTKEIVDALDWFEDAGDEYVTQGDGYVIINAEDNVLATIIGTVISILSKSGDYEEGTYFLSMARKDDCTKVSIRVAGNPDGVHLQEIIQDLAEYVDGEGGGHQYAAGALIPTEQERAFIEYAKEYFADHAS